jgi:hypothetical protein
MTRRIVLIAAVAVLAGCASPPARRDDAAPVTPAAELAPIAHWIGGQWEGTFESGGRKFTVVRTYEWSFDGRMIVGRSFARRDGKLVQTRETPFFWNPESKRIEFIDFLDNGGHGAGVLTARDGQFFMDVRIFGNPAHPSWRATIREEPDAQLIHVEALRDGKWVDFGTYPYRRQR